MKPSHKWGFCQNCDAPLVEGMKLNLVPCPEHPGELLAYCEDCVRVVKKERSMSESFDDMMHRELGDDLEDPELATALAEFLEGYGVPSLENVVFVMERRCTCSAH